MHCSEYLRKLNLWIDGNSESYTRAILVKIPVTSGVCAINEEAFWWLISHASGYKYLSPSELDKLPTE